MLKIVQDLQFKTKFLQKGTRTKPNILESLPHLNEK